MEKYRYSNHTVTRLTVHLVWVTKYCYQVLTGDIQKHCRELLIQICDTDAAVRILNGVISKNHVQMHVEYPASKSISNLVKLLKRRSFRILQTEYTELCNRYWGKHFWAIGYGARSTGNITEKVVQEYLKHHKTSANDQNNFIIE